MVKFINFFRQYEKDSEKISTVFGRSNQLSQGHSQVFRKVKLEFIKTIFLSEIKGEGMILWFVLLKIGLFLLALVKLMTTLILAY